ncbi:carboxylate-amine ligase [Pseudarthrobacter albicanus]|uniref:carboxylate-amine ligase n=1 Tax=Pseudarthrobacter albicanus TaxID=2823873 RepID=UPI0027DCE535|nr:glutamate--cysteine ligase [Pseudarthrobacter albicanus]
MRTFGVEEEFLIVDPYNGSPLPLAAELLRLHDPGRPVVNRPSPLPVLAVELQQEQLEVITRPHSSLSGLAAEIRAGRAYADALARKAGGRIAALATSPVPVAPRHTRNDRYDALIEKFALTAREQLTCGFHVHVSVGSDEEGVAVLDRIRAWLPPLIALSSNSPFWNGTESGYASFRTQAWNRWSSAGPAEVFGSARAYHSLVADLSATGVVSSPDFDARLSARHPTVEVRVSDVCLDARDAALIAALVRALVETAAREWEAGQPPDLVPAAVLRQGAWRASRFGVHGELLHPVTHRPDTARNVLTALHDHVGAALGESGDGAYAAESMQRILSQGTGATRQREAFERNGRLADVVAHATALTHQEPADDDPPGDRFLTWAAETAIPSGELAAIAG